MDLNQVTIEVSDYQQSVAFYSGLGLRLIVSQRDEYARFELPSGSSTFSLHVSDHPAPGRTVIYFEVDDLDRRYQELKGLGYLFDSEPVDQDWRWREAYLTDPDGHRLCLFHAGPDRRFPPWRL
ncbi:VOC family protein [Hoeflea prorocentri]|uniref:VOC family protein n=1 Tax=Hoeflea prorocentri TaxID=1922333 RepID=A0A9X3UFE9_9HYPH|nr:VOC family protein [Hoeflea prorocentri]MCY6379900.1 VOC family protein [Hoeflea prorocentri]MDA5397700.1 VOC family protein [Hoeflea prorocentri]